MSANGPKLVAIFLAAIVRYWHLADIPKLEINFRFRG
jgi:hypothetical protein